MPCVAPTSSLGIVELGTVLGLLFLAFVAVQVRYLFGSAERVATTARLTYAEYARRGFFELVTVTALALPILHLYTQEYGLTELRFYATIFMAWLAVVLIWFLLTVLRGRRDRFAFSALLSGFAAVLLINAMNPDALIACTNLQRLEEGKRFDAYYLTTLSAAPAPVLFDALPEISGNRIVPEADLTVEEVILDRYRQDDEGDWRTWNLSRSRAGFLAETYADPGQMPAEARAERGLDVNFM